MRFESKYKNISFTSSMVFEYAMTAIFTFLAIGMLCLYFFGRSRRHVNTNEKQYLVLLILAGLVAAITTIITISLIRHFRNIWYAVSFEFDDETQLVIIERRKIARSTLERISIPYAQLKWKQKKTSGFLFITQFSGFEIGDQTKNSAYFLTDHFTWEEQGPDRRDIIDKMISIEERNFQK